MEPDSTSPSVPSPASPPIAGAQHGGRRWQAALRRLKGPIAAVAAVGAVLSGLVGYYTSYRAVVSPALSAVAPPAPAARADAGPLSIVVLPFVNFTGDPAQAYMADGLTASVTADLARLTDVFVVGAESAVKYRDKGLPAQDVARELGVHFALQGNVQRSGNHLRINAQMFDASSNAQVWAETFEGDTQDLFALQDQVTTRIGNSMGRELVIRAARESERRPTKASVNDLLLEARALRLKPQSLDNWQTVEAFYREALKREPNNLPAALGLARVLFVRSSNFELELGEKEAERQQKEAAEWLARVTAVDAEYPGVLAEMANQAEAAYRWDEALKLHEAQLTLTPKSPDAHHAVGLDLHYLGRPDEARQQLQEALALDPMHPNAGTLAMMGRTELMRGDADAAIDWLQKAKVLNPGLMRSDANLAAAYALKGDADRAKAAAKALLQADPTFSITREREDALKNSPGYAALFKSRLEPGYRKAGFPE
jgi:TolB-like protein/Tfp pilus assembly protein PilF